MEDANIIQIYAAKHQHQAISSPTPRQSTKQQASKYAHNKQAHTLPQAGQTERVNATQESKDLVQNLGVVAA